MKSLFDELSAKVAADNGVRANAASRANLGMVLYGAREEIKELWDAAENADGTEESERRLKAAADRLAPIFRPRQGRESESAKESER